jgi:hypothetical protein
MGGMLTVERTLAVLAGSAILLATLGSAIATVVLPRSSVSAITRSVFRVMRSIFGAIARPSMPYERRDRILALYAPLALIATLATWLALVLLAYMLIFWGVDRIPWSEAFDVSGSSLFTLGWAAPRAVAGTALVFTEAAIGLFLLALLITYLPAIYSAFSRRELGVTALAVRAGEPPSGIEMMQRYWVLRRMEALEELWSEWERWFVDVEETHTSIAALVFFRSPQKDHSWITSAGAVLDGAALAVSAVDIPRDVQAEFCIRAGYLCLRRVAANFQIPFDADPDPNDPISVTRAEFEEALAAMEEVGVPIVADRDQAWRDFSGWRVNYDTVLLALCSLTSPPYALWSSDRAGGERTVRPPILPRITR